jgi:hypothetical protein
MDQFQKILGRLEALEDTKLPIQILREDGVILDEDVYDLGETIKLKIIPKKKGGNPKTTSMIPEKE